MGKKRPRFESGYRNEIMRLLLANGCITIKSLKLLEKNQVVIERTLKLLENEDIIELLKFQCERRIIKCARLINFEAKSNDYIRAFPAGNYSSYKRYAEAVAIDIKRKDEESIWRRERAARVGETGVMMYASGIKCMPEEKKRLLRGEQIESGTYFFTAYEIKNTLNMVTNSRMTGMLFTENESYVVYHTGARRMRWVSRSESKAVEIMKRASEVYQGRTVTADEPKRAIILGEDKAVTQILKIKNKEQKTTSTVLEIPSGYHELLYYPLTVNGKKNLAIIKEKDWRKHLCEKYLKDCDPPKIRSGIPHDGRREDQNVLLFCIPDLEKLGAFIKFALWSNVKEKYLIRCYEWQMPLLNEVAGNSCLIETVNDTE